MASINRIILSGNVGNIEAKAFESGAVKYKIALAVKRWDNKKKENITDWFNIETFNKLGDFIQKGNKIAVDGNMIQEKYEKDGETKTYWKVFANNIEIFDKKEEKTEENLTENDENLAQFGEIFEEEIKF